jgi:hypothetical protein
VIFYEFRNKLWEHLSGLAHLISSITLNKTGNYGIIKQNALAVSEEAVIYSEQTGLKGHYLKEMEI